MKPWAGLSPKQKKFTELYHKTGNATQSYLDAKYKVKNSQIASEKASRLLASNGKVKAYLMHMQEKQAIKHEDLIEELIAENRKLALQDLNQVLRMDNGKLKPKNDDIDINMLDGVSISKSSSHGDNGHSESYSFSVKLSAKMKGLQELARLIGAYDRKENADDKDPIEAQSKTILEYVKEAGE